MKRTLLLVLATALTAAPALAAIDMNAEVFVTHKAVLQNTELTAATTPKNEGTDVDRFRIFLVNKFNDQWAFKGRFEFRADGTNMVYIPEAHFVGTGVAMANDTVKFGIQDNPAFTMENSTGNRWITKPLIDDEGFAVAGTQSGISYGMKFNALGVTLFSLSAEDGARVDTNDNAKMNGAMLDYKFNDAVTAWIQSATVSQQEATPAAIGVALSTVRSSAIMSAGVNYKSESFDAGFGYHTAAYTVETGTAPKNNMVMGLNGTAKKIAGSNTNIYAHFWTGYDKFDDTGEDTQSKMMIGPTWTLAEGKVNMGVFYQMETFQSDWKAVPANSTAKDPSNLYVKLAAKF